MSTQCERRTITSGNRAFRFDCERYRLTRGRTLLNKLVAFTLAEVLITLTIIGVVAALTLPTLIQKNDEKVAITKVKKFYSVMSQALTLAILNNGTVDTWNFIEKDSETDDIRSNKLAAYLKPYIKIAKDCGQESGCIAEEYKLLNDTGSSIGWVGKYDENPRYYKMILTDGSTMWLKRDTNTASNSIPCNNASEGGYTNVCGVIWLDVNGKNPPNVIGKDTFNFILLKDRIVPDKLAECNTSNEGWGCSSYILQNDNMDYLH